MKRLMVGIMVLMMLIGISSLAAGCGENIISANPTPEEQVDLLVGEREAAQAAIAQAKQTIDAVKTKYPNLSIVDAETSLVTANALLDDADDEADLGRPSGALAYAEQATNLAILADQNETARLVAEAKAAALVADKAACLQAMYNYFRPMANPNGNWHIVIDRFSSTYAEGYAEVNSGPPADSPTIVAIKQADGTWQVHVEF